MYLGFQLWDKDILDRVAHEQHAESLTALGGIEYLAELLVGGPAWVRQRVNRTRERPIIGVVRGRQGQAAFGNDRR